MDAKRLRFTYVSLFFLALVVILLFSESPITGHVTAPIYSQTTNIELSGSGEYEISPNANPVEFSSIRVSGEIIGDGNVEIKIEDEKQNTLTIYSSKREKSLNQITGMAESELAIDTTKSAPIEEEAQPIYEDEPVIPEVIQVEEETTEEPPVIPFTAPEIRETLSENLNEISLEIISPVEDEKVSGNFVLILVDYTTILETNLALYIDNNLYLSMPVTVLEGSQQFFLDTSEYTAGIHNLKVYLYKTENNEISILKEDSVNIEIVKEIIEDNEPITPGSPDGTIVPGDAEKEDGKPENITITEENITEENVTETTPQTKPVTEPTQQVVSTGNLIIKATSLDTLTNIQQKTTENVKRFTSVCSDTCFLRNNQLSGTVYKLIINTDPGTQVKVDRIIYGQY